MKKKWLWLIGLLILILLAAGGFWWHQQSQQKAQQEAAAKVLRQLDRTQADLQQQLTDSWVAKHYVKKTVTASTVSGYAATLKQTATKAKPYTKASGYAHFAKRQQTLTQALAKLKAAQVATQAANALFAKPVLTGATTHKQVLIRPQTKAQTIQTATHQATGVNATLKRTLSKATDLAQKQLSERDDLTKQVATIAQGDKLKAGVTLAQLTAFQKFLTGLTYPGLKAPYQALVTAVGKKVQSLGNIKSISLTELQKRVLLAYVSGTKLDRSSLSGVRPFFVDSVQSSFQGDTYQGAIGVLNFRGEDLMPSFKFQVTVKPNGSYTLVRDFDQIATGNLMTDFSQKDVTQVTGDPTNTVTPKVTTTQLEAAINAKLEAENPGSSADVSYVPAETHQAPGLIEIGLARGDVSWFRYDPSTGEAAVEGDTSDPDDYYYEPEVTEYLWAKH